MVFYSQTILPTIICSLPLLRHVLLREKITLVHGHSAFSSLAHECIMAARFLNIKVNKNNMFNIFNEND